MQKRETTEVMRNGRSEVMRVMRIKMRDAVVTIRR
jgi:hypothetical protein